MRFVIVEGLFVRQTKLKVATSLASVAETYG
ncbi:uncharacterized protein METZ01_LOCUS490589 [marine metagenome]|uniref:Uncharacterized protein n=1 Tax=marine metagenome TaxID=408172 RepID=A0A383D0I0_9ZZZZ